MQVVIAVAEKYMRSADPRFPVGRTRLETVGVVACAIIMTIATIEVIQSAAQDLYAGFVHGAEPPVCVQHCYTNPGASRSTSVRLGHLAASQQKHMFCIRDVSLSKISFISFS